MRNISAMRVWVMPRMNGLPSTLSPILRVLPTRDLDFTDIRRYPPESHPGLVVSRLPDDSTAKVILEVLERFFSQAELIARIPGRLVIVERDRARIRPPV